MFILNKIFNLNPTKNPLPTLTTRLFAALLDCVVVMMVVLPLQQFIVSFIYEVPPTDELSSIIESTQSSPQSGLVKSLQRNSEMRGFVKEGKFKFILFTQLFQLACLIAYVLFFWIRYQATPGKMLISSKIIDEKTGGKPSVKQCIIRLFSYFISALPLFMGFFMVAFNKNRRALHDLIAGTKVVSTKKNEK